MKICKKIKKHLNYIINQKNYIKYYKNLKLDEKSILLESQHGREINGNIFYIIQELCNNDLYAQYKINLTVDKPSKNKIESVLKNYNFTRVKTVCINTDKYYKTIATAKYLINDNTFLPFFIKKDGQVYLNTWHGTPLKTLGKKIKNDMHNIGNTQRNFILADYLLYPNEYTMDHIVKDYMIENLSKAKALIEGYPRNTAFFDNARKQELIEKHKLKNKQVIAYMPTWRGVASNQDTDIQQISLKEHLDSMEQKLAENQVMYVNLHPIERAMVDYSNYKKIKPFPEQYETYEFLNCCDILITDYSSVFFDYALTKKKIILFTYDKEQYLADRGLYISLDELPFPKVESINDLFKEINSEKKYDDSEFLQKFCNYDNINATKKICELMIFNNKTNLKIIDLPNNNKENVLIYSGNLAKNGITTALLNLLEKIDLNDKNYYLTFPARKVRRNKETLLKFPNGANYIPIMGKMNTSIKGKFVSYLYEKGYISTKTLLKNIKEDYMLEIKRLYCYIKFNTVIQYNGYEDKRIILFSLFDANRVIYAHSDMYSEIFIKGNQKLDTCKYAYENYDKIALVSEGLIEQSSKILDVKEKFYVCNNVFDYKRVLNMSKENIKLDEKTVSNITKEELEEILNNQDLKKFIAIGRFSKEKGLDRLLNAFEEFWKSHDDTYLVVIGGYGKEYKNLLKQLSKLNCKNNVALIKSMNNPYSVLNKCDYLIFPSRYEGFGLVIIEADVLGKPVVSTDIAGPRKFMQMNNGQLVENSTKGIKQGLDLLYYNKVKPMNVDYEKYNQEAIKEFYNLFKTKRSE